MAETKAELVKKAADQGITLDPKAKVSEIRAALAEHAAADTMTEAVEAPAAPEVAKAGKRSAKALAEAKEKEEKTARKAEGPAAESKLKPVVPKTRSRRERRGKLYRKNAELLDADKFYSLEEAVSLAKKTSHVKFDATVELHVNLGVDPRHADQNVRDSVILPAGNGKVLRVAVLSDDPAAARSAGADASDNDALLADLDKSLINFDVLIATPAQMPKLGKYARVLGPRGLMPNPKSGTVTTDIAKAVKEAKGGRVEYRVDSTGIVHVGVGKVSFSDEKLIENIQTILTSIKTNKPSGLKGTYVRAIHLATSMGPATKIDVAIAN